MTKILVSKFMESNQEDEEEGINNPVAVGYLNKALYILNDATQKDEMKQVSNSVSNFVDYHMMYLI